jgi:fatty acid desaturase
MDHSAIKHVTTLVKDLHRPRQSIYWIDLLACVAAAAAGLYLSRPFPDKVLAGSATAVLGLIVAAFALYRASYFNHELAHHSRDLRGFAIGWNLLIGIPLLVPSFLYSDHLNHHSIKNFATDSDVEYVPPELCGIRAVALLLAACLLLPIAYVGRFLLLAPLAWCNRAVRRWADIRVSSLGIFGLSKRKPPTAAEVVSWRVQEFGCFVYCVLTTIGIARGLVPIGIILQGYTVVAILLLLHAIRIMVGHRHDADGSRDRVDQVLDSFNFTRNPLITCLMAPLGFHLHALHHLFPKIPYHNMREAHRRVSAALPPGSFYHQTEDPSYFRAVARFMVRNPRPSGDRRPGARADSVLAGGAAGGLFG